MWFVDESAYENSSRQEFYIREGMKERHLNDLLSRATPTGIYMREFGLFGKKKLEKINPYDLDYIDLKIDQISSDVDKMMIVSYIHNKMDMVNFYLDILEDPTASKKYNVPHGTNYLLSVKKQLELLRDKAMKKAVPPKLPDIYVAYPAGYEG